MSEHRGPLYKHTPGVLSFERSASANVTVKSETSGDSKVIGTLKQENSYSCFREKAKKTSRGRLPV